MVGRSEFQRIRALEEETLAWLATWPEHHLSYKPKTTEWSALEVVDHLARTDRSIVESLRKGTSSPVRLTFRNRIAGKVFNLMFLSPVRVKTPAAARAILPTAPRNLAEAAESWKRSVSTLETFLSGLEEEPSGGVFTHPVAGPMSMATALRFLEVHTRHHLHQLRRVRRLAASSATSV